VTLNGLNVVPVWGAEGGGTWERSRYRSIARHGFNSVRFVLYWDALEPQRGAFAASRLATLDRAVANARSAGLYVLLDMIHLWGRGGMRSVPAWARAGDSVATIQANAAPYVRMLAARYARDPAVAAYDPVNEPYRWPMDQNAVMAMYDRLIAAIRQVAPHKIVMVEPTYGDSSLDSGCVDFGNLVHRRDVVLSIHDYFAGGDDDGFGPGCRQSGAHGFDGRTGYRPRQRAQLQAHLRAYVDAAARAGLALEVGEYGMGVHARGQRRWVRDTVRLFDRYGLSRAWWEYRTRANGASLSATDRRGRWRSFTRLLTATSPPANDEKGLQTCA
jgi:hypothetical protein